MDDQAPPWWLIPIVIVSFAVVFPLFWSAISFLLATLAGWRSMARRFPCPRDLSGEPLDAGYANRVGLVGYRGVLSLEATSDGLIARVPRLFPFHAALLLPWSSLTLARGGFLCAGRLLVEGGGAFALNRTAWASVERVMASRAGR